VEYSEVLRLKEAADYVRVSEKTLREMANTNRVPCQRVGREWRFLRKALDEWLAGTEPTGSRVRGVSESVGQLYLPTAEAAERPERNGFGDTAFTKNREAPIHSWVPWIAGFSASFVGELLDRELARASKLTVLDPFAGVGTTLVEGIRRQCDVLGFEINPYAALACQVKLEALSRNPSAIRQAAERIDSELRSRLRRSGGRPTSQPPPGFHSRDPFFSPRVEQQILFAKDLIAEEKEDWLRRLICLALGALMVGVSNYTYEPSLGRRAAVGKGVIADADLPRILRDKLLRMAHDVEAWQIECGKARRRPRSRVFSESYLTGAARCLDEASVDVLVTSPPYLNNYHYVRNTRPQMFWLDFVVEAADLRQLETSSFGKFWQTVRSEPQIPLAFSYPELEKKLSELRSLHPEKGAYGGAGWANYAVTYFNDCARFCEVTARVMTPGGLVVVVIGNNILQGVEFKTDELLAHIAEQYGFEIRGLHRVRKKRTGSSIINSSVRVGTAKEKAELYETAIELRMGSALKRA
jgi:excisionase family DNA binding protein